LDRRGVVPFAQPDLVQAVVASTASPPPAANDLVPTGIAGMVKGF
jgi:hypothetical protein